MQIKLMDNTTFDLLRTTGRSQYVQGANRDCLTFELSPEAYTLAQVEAAFTSANTDKIVLLDSPTTTEVDGQQVTTIPEYIHDHYNIRTEMSLRPVVIQEATGTEPEQSELRICVTMAQMTYQELQMQQQAQQITDTQVAMCEVYEMMLGGVA